MTRKMLSSRKNTFAETPFIIAIARSVTLNLSSPKERKPMMGFLGFVLISRTGAKLN
jgi:hypothetical protein